VADPTPAGTVLVCLPFAGSGGSFFRGWKLRAPAGLEVLPVQLAGREERFDEPPPADVATAVADAYGQIRGGARIALFGHSLGAVLAYELAHRLTDGGAEVVALFASGSPDPWHGRTHRLTGLGDDDFMTGVQTITGHSHPALADPEIRELVLPLLRSDIRMHEDYRAGSDRPLLPVPITAVRGRDDDLVSAADAGGWRRATSAGFGTAELDGGHMYLLDGPDPLLALIAERLDLVGSP
jgi:surfactin synthase thioesterase subunit